MTKKEFNNAFFKFFGTNAHCHQVWGWNHGSLMASKVKDYDMRSLVMPDEVMRTIMNYGCVTYNPVQCVSLAPLPTATCSPYFQSGDICKKQEVDNDMYTTKTTANTLEINLDARGSSTPAKSDIQSQRDMILATLDSEFGQWRDSKYADLREMFNINAKERPDTFAELAAAIKAGKFEVDQKKIDKRIAYIMDDYGYDDEEQAKEHIGMWYGVTFTDLPKADQEGYDAAMKAWERAKKEAREDIMVLEPAQGLATLRALRDWKPTGKAN